MATPAPGFDYAAVGGEMIAGGDAWEDMVAESAGYWDKILSFIDSANVYIHEFIEDPITHINILMANPVFSFIVGACIFMLVLKIVTKVGGTLVKAIIIAALVAFFLSVMPTLTLNFGNMLP